MKTEKDYIIYRTDTDGSERKAGVFTAKGKAHAISIARKSGITKITEAVEADNDYNKSL